MNGTFGYGKDFYARQVWRFVSVQPGGGEARADSGRVSSAAGMASFNLDAVNRQIEEAMKFQESQ